MAEEVQVTRWKSMDGLLWDTKEAAIEADSRYMVRHAKLHKIVRDLRIDLASAEFIVNHWNDLKAIMDG
jgi:hypothetical protein